MNNHKTMLKFVDELFVDIISMSVFWMDCILISIKHETRKFLFNNIKVLIYAFCCQSDNKEYQLCQ